MTDDTPPLPYRPAVGIMLLNRRGLVLAGQRASYPEGAWQMPQGGLDEGESPEDAARRELAEETGITEVEMLRAGGTYCYDFPKHHKDDRWRGQEQKWFALRFVGDEGKVDVRQVAHPEFLGHAWLAPAEVLRRIVTFKRPVYQKVFADFADLLGR